MNRLAPLVALGLCAAMTACAPTSEAEDVAAETHALDLPHPHIDPRVISPDLFKAHTLRIHTCDIANGQSDDPVELVTSVSNTAVRTALGAAGATRNGWFARELFLTQMPWDLDSVTALLLRKRGHDAWCFDRVELVYESKVVWSWDNHTAPAGDDLPYAGVIPSPGVIWLDDDRVTAPTASVRFSEIPAGSHARPTILEIETCSDAQHASAGTTDPVEATFAHDWYTEAVPLDNIGSDRQAGDVDRFILEEHGIGITLGDVTIRKTGKDPWCIARARVLVEGQQVGEKHGRFVIDADAATAAPDHLVVPVTLPVLPKFPQNRILSLPLQRSPGYVWGVGEIDQRCRAACNPLTELHCDRCFNDLACDPATQTCQPAGGHGELCQEVGNPLFPGSNPPPRCDAGLSCTLGRCHLPGETFGACRTSGSACNPGLSCHQGLCRRAGSEDGPCRENGHACDGTLQCEAGTCRQHQEVSDTTQACVPHVEQEFAAINTDSETKLHVRTPPDLGPPIICDPPMPNCIVTESSGCQNCYPDPTWVPASAPAYSPVPAAWPGNLANRQDNCHIQGFQRLSKPGYLAFVANSRVNDDSGFFNGCDMLPVSLGGGAHLFIGYMGSKASKGQGHWGAGAAHQDDRVLTELRLNYDGPYYTTDADWQTKMSTRHHPGGFQVVGDYLYVGIDGLEQRSELRIFDVKNPLEPKLVGKASPWGSQASATGAVALPDGRMLVGVGNLSNSGARFINFFTVDTSQQDWNPVPRDRVVADGMRAYASINFVRECGTSKIYMLGIGNDADFPMCRKSGNAGGSDSGYFDLWQVNGAVGSLSMTKVSARSTRTNNASGCAGAGVFVGSGGDLSVYQMEHSSDSGSIRFYEYAAP
jgi:hypothetical protein